MYPEFNPVEQIKQSADAGHGGAFSMNFDPSEDRALGVRFYTDKQINQQKSKDAGTAVYDDVEMCEIRIPGTQDVIRNVVSDKEKSRFPRQYAAFQQDKDQDSAVGTPLTHWPIITTSPGSVETARALGIRTVEQLAQAPDAGIQRLGPGWLDLRKKARTWLLAAKDGAVLNRLHEELAERDRRLAALEQMLNKQAEELAAARNGVVPAPAAPAVDMAALIREQVAAALAARKPAEAPKRRGRPPKAKQDQPAE